MISILITTLQRLLFGALYVIAVGCGTQVGNPSGTDEQPKKAKDTMTSPAEAITDPLNFPDDSTSDTQSGTTTNTPPPVGSSTGTITKCSAQSNVKAAPAGSSGEISLLFSNTSSEPITVKVLAPDSKVSDSVILSPLVKGIYQVTAKRGATKTCVLKIKIDETTVLKSVSITISDI